MYEQIVKECYAAILSYCCMRLQGDLHGAEDCTQEVFLLLYEKQSSLHDTNLRGWLYATADRKLLEYRRKNPQSADLDSIPEAVEMPVLSDQESVLDLLTEEEQRMVTAYFSGEDREQLARHLGLSKGALYLRICRIRKKLRKLMGGEKHG